MKNIAAVYITGHGLGHLSQSTEVLIALYKQNTQIQFKIITSIPEVAVIARIAGKIPASHIDYIYDQTGSDIGIPMVDAMQVDQERTIAAYKNIHSQWVQHIDFEQQRLIGLKADIVLSNVAYIPLQAAANISIPSVALCSLEWASTWQIFGSDDEAGKRIFNQIVDAYRSATLFLQMTPHLPMPFLDNTVSVPVVVRQGISSRQIIDQRFPQCLGKKLIMVSMGGMDAEMNFDQWPKINEVVYLVTGKKHLPGDYLDANKLGLDFSDVMASVDAVLTKTGYGMVVESVINQTPLFYVARADWPEHEVMFKWAQANNRVLEIYRDELDQGLTKEKIESLLSQQVTNKVFEVKLGADMCVKKIHSLM